MPDNIHLIIHNVFCIISAIVVIGTALFTYLNNKRNMANIMISLAMLMIVVFYISHIIGISISDPNISRDILMCNLCMFAAGVFQTHAVLSLVGRTRQDRLFLILTYVIGIFFIVFFIIFLRVFLVFSLF